MPVASSSAVSSREAAPMFTVPSCTDLTPTPDPPPWMVTLIVGFSAVKATPNFSAKGWTVVDPASVIVWDDVVVDVVVVDVVVVEVFVVLVVVEVVVWVEVEVVVFVVDVWLHPARTIATISNNAIGSANHFDLFVISYSFFITIITKY
jgi:hypothetical protein